VFARVSLHEPTKFDELGWIGFRVRPNFPQPSARRPAHGGHPIDVGKNYKVIDISRQIGFAGRPGDAANAILRGRLQLPPRPRHMLEQAI
jgi:hypothetical protein